MKKKEMIPLIDFEQRVSEAILEMTSKGEGCVGVISNKGLLKGIITDGDLRRHMSNDLLKKKVTDIMTRNPKTLSIDTSLTDALKLMNKQSITNYFITKKYEAIRNYSFTRYTVSSMKYSFVIKFIKYFLLFISIFIFSVLAFKTIPTTKKNENIISFESEQFSSASQILSKPLFMGLDKKKKTF